jgi:hypothetical protein
MEARIIMMIPYPFIIHDKHHLYIVYPTSLFLPLTGMVHEWPPRPPLNRRRPRHARRDGRAGRRAGCHAGWRTGGAAGAG